MANSGLIGGICGHVGDGNFHSEYPTYFFLLIMDADTKTAILLYNDTEKDVAEGVVHRMIHRAIAMEGTVTGEHGVGLKKREYIREELGDDTVDAMRRVSVFLSTFEVSVDANKAVQLKQAFDPMGLLNPDKIVQIEQGH